MSRAEENNATQILVVDDDRLVRMTLATHLRKAGHSVETASSGSAALEKFTPATDLVLLDYKLPDVSGAVVMSQMIALRPEVPIIVLTGYSSVENAVEAMKLGAYHYVAKPVQLETVGLLVERALEAYRLRRQIREMGEHEGEGSVLDSIVGESAEIRRVKQLLPRIATSPATTVLVIGESGTGKDLVARALHELSPRAGGPFVNITCSALPAPLLESELFGHERGAFTDAKNRKLGLFEQADGGTVFLDEMGELELQLQAKLLRFLEDRKFRRVGGTEEIHADVRVVAATNVDLKRAVANRNFREDLYYRLAVVLIQLPPLRDRCDDIEPLAAHFVAHFNRKFGKDVRSISPDTVEMLRAHPWPGNIRELRNAIERAVLLSTVRVLRPANFEFLRETAVDEAVVRLPAGGLDVRDVERDLVEQALARTGGNKTRAAELLGMNRDQIRYRMRRYGLPDQYGKDAGPSERKRGG